MGSLYQRQLGLFRARVIVRDGFLFLGTSFEAHHHHRNGATTVNPRSTSISALGHLIALIGAGIST